jgi:hypothetical protein
VILVPAFSLDEEEVKLEVDNDEDEVEMEESWAVIEVLDAADPATLASEEAEEEVWLDDVLVVIVVEDAAEVAALWAPTSKKTEARMAMPKKIASTTPTADALLIFLSCLLVKRGLLNPPEQTY